MALTESFLLYAALYRLTIIGAGALSIALGYRLFLRGITLAGDGTSAAAEAGGVKLSVAGAAPGTCFALFGAALIVAMVVQGSPELALQGAGQTAAHTPLSSRSVELNVRLKGGQGESALVAQANREADAASERGDLSGAIAVYGRALSASGVSADEIATVAGHIARLYLMQKRIPEALALSRLAVQVAADDPDNLEALAAAAKAAGEHQEAQAAAARAASIRDSDK